MARDITEQKLLCEQLVQSEKLAAIGRFVSAVAHELNNPLTVIVGFAEILLSNLELNEQDQADLQMVASEANRARQMVRDLLSLSREQLQEKQSLDLNQLIATTLDHHQDDLRASQIRVITNLASNLPPVSADPHQLRQVFTHIMNHIRKSLTTASHGGTLRVETALQQVRTRAGLSRIAAIRFVDDGPSQSQESLRQLFEPRYTTKEEDRGLGLALSYNLIRQHGGQLYALSRPGEGVRLVIELPYED